MSRKLTTDEFVARAREVHGDRYDYSRSVYKTSGDKITVICRDHGAFKQVASSHMSGIGCKHCYWDAGGGRRQAQGAIAAQLREVLPETITFELPESVSTKSHITFNCARHGSWKAQINNVLYNGSRCPVCAKRGFNPNKPGTCYYLRVDTPTGRFYKVGITNTPLKQRFKDVPSEIRITVLWEDWHEIGERAQVVERAILDSYASYRISRKSLKFMGHAAGNTECFYEDVLGFDKEERADE